MRIHRKIKPFHTDERGELSHLLADEEPITSAVLITSRKGSVRANHYHKKDTHHVYVIKGSMEYTYKKLNPSTSLRVRTQSPIQSGTKLKTIIVNAGEIVATSPMTMHAMKFLEDSVFLALTTEPRNSKQYEKDTVRVKLIETE